jgi:hypothetical protein
MIPMCPHPPPSVVAREAAFVYGLNHVLDGVIIRFPGDGWDGFTGSFDTMSSY